RSTITLSSPREMRKYLFPNRLVPLMPMDASRRGSPAWNALYRLSDGENPQRPPSACVKNQNACELELFTLYCSSKMDSEVFLVRKNETRSVSRSVVSLGTWW